MLEKQLITITHFGSEYPPSPEAEALFFKSTSKKELAEIFRRAIQDPITRNGLDLDLAPLDATFRDSGQAPLHSWFPYLEGYSPRFVERVRHEYLGKARSILEPFAGTGTTPIVLGQAGIACAFSEANPAMAFIAETKLSVLRLPLAQQQSLARKLTKIARELPSHVALSPTDEHLRAAYLGTFGTSVFFDDASLEAILRLRSTNDELSADDRLTA